MIDQDLEQLAMTIRGVIEELRKQIGREGRSPEWDEPLLLIADALEQERVSARNSE